MEAQYPNNDELPRLWATAWHKGQPGHDALTAELTRIVDNALNKLRRKHGKHTLEPYAEDLQCEGYLAIAEARGQARGNIGGYLATTAINRMRDYLRREWHKKTPKTETDLAATAEAEARELGHIPDDEPTGEQPDDEDDTPDEDPDEDEGDTPPPDDEDTYTVDPALPLWDAVLAECRDGIDRRIVERRKGKATMQQVVNELGMARGTVCKRLQRILRVLEAKGIVRQRKIRKRLET